MPTPAKHPTETTLTEVRDTHATLTLRWRALRTLNISIITLMTIAALDAYTSIGADVFIGTPYSLLSATRSGLMLAWLVLTVCLIIWTSRAARIRRRSILPYARLADQHLHNTSQSITQAAALIIQPTLSVSNPASLTHQLTLRRIHQADALLNELPKDALLSRKLIQREIQYCGIIAFLFVAFLASIALTAYPKNPTHVIKRLFFPTLESRPFGTTGFTIQYPQTIAIGDDVTIDIKTTENPALSEIQIHTRTQHSTDSFRLKPTDSANYLHTFSQLTTPLQFRVQSRGSFSDWHTLTPLPLPKLLAVTITQKRPQTDLARTLAYPLDQPIPARIGDTFTIEAITDQSDASLIFADQSDPLNTLTHTHTVQPGPQTIALQLFTPTGLRSKQTIRFTIQGLTPTELKNLQQKANPANSENNNDPTSTSATDPTSTNPASDGDPTKMTEGATALPAAAPALATLSNPNQSEESSNPDATGTNPGQNPDATGSARGTSAASDPLTPTDIQTEPLFSPAISSETLNTWPENYQNAPPAYHDQLREFRRLLDTPLTDLE